MSTQYGVHLSRNAAVRPSIFEVLAQENLTLGLRTAIRYMSHFSAQTWPERCAWLFRYSDELILGLDLLLQYHHLVKYSGSFAEHFYGLARLGKVKLFRSLLLLSVLPYIHSKLESLYQKWKDDEADMVRSRYETIRTFYLRFYPYLYFVTEGSYFLTAILYALGRSECHSVSLMLSGSSLEYYSRDRHRRQRSAVANAGLQWYLWPLITCRRLLSKAADQVSTALMTGAFLLQFLEWWYQSHDVNPFYRSSAVPPSPASHAGDGDANRLTLGRPLPKGKCPICKEAVVNETVLATSGLSFCYSCIFKHLLENSSCPVTGYPSSVDALIKVYQ